MHQVCVVPSRDEVTRRHIADRREFADGHGDFITGVAAGTVHAVFHHFVGQGLMVGGAEVEVFEERWNAGE